MSLACSNPQPTLYNVTIHERAKLDFLGKKILNVFFYLVAADGVFPDIASSQRPTSVPAEHAPPPPFPPPASYFPTPEIKLPLKPTYHDSSSDEEFSDEEFSGEEFSGDHIDCFHPSVCHLEHQVII